LHLAVTGSTPGIEHVHGVGLAGVHDHVLTRKVRADAKPDTA
jgi:hypothetical protein